MGSSGSREISKEREAGPAGPGSPCQGLRQSRGSGDAANIGLLRGWVRTELESSMSWMPGPSHMVAMVAMVAMVSNRDHGASQESDSLVTIDLIETTSPPLL